MPEFRMDKGGIVHESFRWDDLDAFTQGYVEAMFFTENEPDLTRENMNTPEGRVIRETGHEIPSDYGFADLAPETLRKIMADCERFQSSEGADQILADCYCREGYGPTQAGHDFWLSRNSHGTGFWDRDALKADGFGDTLTGIAADEFGQTDAYLGDDGLIYLS